MSEPWGHCSSLVAASIELHRVPEVRSDACRSQVPPPLRSPTVHVLTSSPRRSHTDIYTDARIQLVLVELNSYIVEYLSLSLSHTHTFRGHSASPINLMWIFLVCGRKPEYQKGSKLGIKHQTIWLLPVLSTLTTEPSLTLRFYIKCSFSCCLSLYLTILNIKLLS